MEDARANRQLNTICAVGIKDMSANTGYLAQTIALHQMHDADIDMAKLHLAMGNQEEAKKCMDRVAARHC